MAPIFLFLSILSLSDYFYIYLGTFLSVHFYTYLNFHLYGTLSIYHPIYLPLYLSTSLSIYNSNCLSLFLSTSISVIIHSIFVYVLSHFVTFCVCISLSAYFCIRDCRHCVRTEILTAAAAALGSFHTIVSHSQNPHALNNKKEFQSV